MTHEQESELGRAIDRATAYGIEVVAKGRRKDRNQRIYCTTSHSQPDRWHVVTLAGKRLVCDCKSSAICAHRGAVHMHLLVAAMDRIDFADRVQEAAEAEVKATREAAREASTRRGPRAFSLVK